MYLANRKYQNYFDFLRFQLKRILILIVSAFTVTVFSYFLNPKMYIGFGILHLIAVVILILTIIPRNYFLILGTFVLLGVLSFVLPSSTLTNDVLFFLGRHSPAYQAYDYFPIFPWILIPYAGYLSAGAITKFATRFLSTIKFPSLCVFLGQHSLVVYLIHQPILIAGLYSAKLILDLVRS
jgi:uncharacterized membrane protein